MPCTRPCDYLLSTLLYFIIAFLWLFPFITLETIYKFLYFSMNLLGIIYSFYKTFRCQLFYFLYSLIICPTLKPTPHLCHRWSSCWSMLAALVYSPTKSLFFTKSMTMFAVIFNADDGHYEWMKRNLIVVWICLSCWLTVEQVLKWFPLVICMSFLKDFLFSARTNRP